MTSITIRLPETLKQYVETQVERGDWGTPGEYIRELVRQDRERRLATVEEALLEGASSPGQEIAAEEIRRRGLIPILRERFARP